VAARGAALAAVVLVVAACGSPSPTVPLSAIGSVGDGTSDPRRTRRSGSPRPSARR